MDGICNFIEHISTDFLHQISLPRSVELIGLRPSYDKGIDLASFPFSPDPV